jgi:hypothetical protein
MLVITRTTGLARQHAPARRRQPVSHHDLGML